MVLYISFLNILSKHNTWGLDIKVLKKSMIVYRINIYRIDTYRIKIEEILHTVIFQHQKSNL